LFARWTGKPDRSTQEQLQYAINHFTPTSESQKREGGIIIWIGLFVYKITECLGNKMTNQYGMYDHNTPLNHLVLMKWFQKNWISFLFTWAINYPFPLGAILFDVFFDVINRYKEFLMTCDVRYDALVWIRVTVIILDSVTSEKIKKENNTV
jgi:hypothetical protein